MSTKKLFEEFAPVSTQQWEEVIVKDLKGADYQKKLIWKTDEGFLVRPYYRAEDLKAIEYLEGFPTESPYIRGNSLNNKWNIVQEIQTPSIVEAHKIAIESIEKGANALVFNTQNIKNTTDFSTLLKDINLNEISIYFTKASSYPELTTFFVTYLKKEKIDLNSIHGGLDFDAIAYLLKNQKFYRNQKEDMLEVLTLLQLTQELPNFKILNINAALLNNAGSTMIQELGYGIAIANEYLAYTAEHHIHIDDISPKIQFTFSIGSNYFMEIAKLRAARLLWATIIEVYHPEKEQSASMYILSQASLWNKTIYDPYVNMLRTTTEGMSASIGGADAISLRPYDAAYKNDDDFSRRISRNVQVLLKEESYFDKVADPAAGSYYIENLTDSIAEVSWNLFQDTEKQGGIIKLIENGSIKAEVEKSCQKRDMDIATRKLVLLGTNQYPNINETMLDKIKPSEIIADNSEGLKAYRGAMAFENLRLSTEKFAVKNNRPKVFLFKIGNIAMRQARAGFATNFFGCAGYEIIDNAGFKTIDEALKAIQEIRPAIVVLCSSDEEYATLGLDATKAIKNFDKSIIIVVAGNPTECINDLNTAGVSDYIHVKVNVLNTLTVFNQKLGIL